LDGAVPTYAAFLRAINLGPTRKFPKADIKAAVEAAGMADVQTYINTGNVRFATSLRSRAKIEAALEKSFKADRGFEVPTFVFTPADLVAIAEHGDELWAEHGEPKSHYVTLFRSAPQAAAIKALLEADFPEDTIVVDGRAAHCLMFGGFHESKAQSSKLFAGLGQGTARNINVIRTLAQKWA
jgi:uncharacterized protein (DUF1697 family)